MDETASEVMARISGSPARKRSGSHSDVPPYKRTRISHSPPANNYDSKDSPHTATSRARLTRKNLKLFTRSQMGATNQSSGKAPSARDAASKVSSGSGSGVTGMTGVSGKTDKTVSASDPRFASRADDNGILSLDYSEPPLNLEGIQRRIHQERETPLLDDAQHSRYHSKISASCNENTVNRAIQGFLLKEYDAPYKAIDNAALNGVAQDAPFRKGLSAAQPDHCEGWGRQAFPQGSMVLVDFPTAVLRPKDLMLAHFAGEWKELLGNMKQGITQAIYDGATMVHCRNETIARLRQQGYPIEPDPPKHAKVFTCVSDGWTFMVLCHYSATAEYTRDPMYHSTVVYATNVATSRQDLEIARRVLRNCQDYAKQRATFIRDALLAHEKNCRKGLAASRAAGKQTERIIRSTETSIAQGPQTPLKADSTPSARSRISNTLDKSIAQKKSSSNSSRASDPLSGANAARNAPQRTQDIPSPSRLSKAPESVQPRKHLSPRQGQSQAIRQSGQSSASPQRQDTSISNGAQPSHLSPTRAQPSTYQGRGTTRPSVSSVSPSKRQESTRPQNLSSHQPQASGYQGTARPVVHTPEPVPHQRVRNVGKPDGSPASRSSSGSGRDDRRTPSTGRSEASGAWGAAKRTITRTESEEQRESEERRGRGLGGILSRMGRKTDTGRQDERRQANPPDQGYGRRW